MVEFIGRWFIAVAKPSPLRTEGDVSDVHRCGEGRGGTRFQVFAAVEASGRRMPLDSIWFTILSRPSHTVVLEREADGH